jgi:RNase H-fold protein (predicted Holliday junction resolvase)
VSTTTSKDLAHASIWSNLMKSNCADERTSGSHDPDVVLAVDPGRSKCGLAVVSRDGTVVSRLIVPTAEIPTSVVRIAALLKPLAILVGDGTGSKAVRTALATQNPACPIITVDERHTSERARARYVAEHRARGWRRLLPASLRTPESEYDDYVAILLAERWWTSNPEAKLDTP